MPTSSEPHSLPGEACEVGGGPGLWPTWERCAHCHAQLYIHAETPAGQPGFWRPRFAAQQRHCPVAADAAHPGHQQDLTWARRFLGPRCDARVWIDGPDRAAIDCPRRPRRQIRWNTTRVGGSPVRQERAGCHQHFPAMAEGVDADVALIRRGRPDWPPPVVTDVVLVVSGRDLAHGRSGTWTAADAGPHVQYRLF